MTKDEALRLALEALEFDSFYATGKQEAITAIKAALEAKDEPAAWMYPDDLKRFETSEAYAEAYSIEMVSPTQGETVPLYTTPPQRKPLTDEEIQDALEVEFLGSNLKRNWQDDLRVARAIEAAHGIKGEA
jgi:hypothetical protein